MTFTAEEYKQFLDSDLWNEIKDYLIEERESAKEELSSLDFSDPKANVQAVKFQAMIESINSMVEKVLSMGDDDNG